MPIQHMVWLKRNADTTETVVDGLLNDVKKLSSLPGVQSIVAGKNFTERAQGYSHGIIVSLGDKNALSHYAEHPDHVVVVKKLVLHCAVLAMDLDV